MKICNETMKYVCKNAINIALLTIMIFINTANIPFDLKVFHLVCLKSDDYFKFK